MYRVIKPKGYGALVTLQITDTSTRINLGQISPAILKILDDNGYTEVPSTPDEWYFEVNKEAAETLSKLAMPMKKPVRVQKKVTKNDIPKDKDKIIDVLDIIYGLNR